MLTERTSRTEYEKQVIADYYASRNKSKYTNIDFERWLYAVTPSFNWDWHHLVFVREKFKKIELGASKKIMICMPPRHGKTEQCTIRFPGYFLERYPTSRVVIGCYNQTLANKFSRKTRRIMRERIALSEERSAVEEWETENGGSFRAIGVGSGITGQGADLIVIDDPVKSRIEANSLAYRERCWDWYTDDLYTRREPGCSIILIMTRWHNNDLAGRILESEDASNWDVINLPALAESNDPLGRLEGEALCPERYNRDALLEIKSVQHGSFDALYQGRPSSIEGEIFKREYWRYYREVPIFDKIVHSWDTAFKKGAENDFSVCTIWGQSKSGYYLLYRWKQRVEFPELKMTVILLANQVPANEILIEDKASGQSLIQELQRETRLPIIPYKIDRDKVARANAVTPIIEAGKVYLPENADWGVQDYIDCLAAFPNDEHDDDVDSTTQALSRMNNSISLSFSCL